jgi:hypothetical protein
MRLQRQYENGQWWDDERSEKFIGMVLAREPEFAPIDGREPMVTRQHVLDYLATGKTLRYSCDWYANIRDADALKPRATRPVVMVNCDCGHSVSAGLVMSASRGTSCHDCYDRMSG